MKQILKGKWCISDLLTALLIALIVVGDMGLTVTLCQTQAENAQVEAVMSEAQARIDAYYASLPAQERPVVVSVAPVEPVVTVAPVVEAKAPEEPETPEWYIEDIPLDRDLQKALWDACQEFGVDYALALAVIEQETNYQNQCGDGGDSIGYFQVQPKWWSELMESIGVDNLTDAEQNFRAGCAILRELLLRYDGSVTDTLTAYNSGHPGQSAYAESVMEAAGVLAQ